MFNGENGNEFCKVEPIAGGHGASGAKQGSGITSH